MKELVERMAQAVVSDPESVSVQELEDASGTTYILTVAPFDMGRAIGKQGRVANAMRTVMRVSAGIEGRRVRLEIEPKETGKEPSSGGFGRDL